jgi:hypothetical protein
MKTPPIPEPGRRPSSVQLPAARVEPALKAALTSIALEQGRSVSDLIRCYLRESVESQSRKSGEAGAGKKGRDLEVQALGRGAAMERD